MAHSLLSSSVVHPSYLRGLVGGVAKTRVRMAR